MDELEQETAPVVAGGGEASQPPQAQEIEGMDGASVCRCVMS